MSARRIAAGVVLVVLVLAVVLYSRRGPAAVVVDTGAVVARDVFRSSVTASGEIVAVRYADIGTNVMGRIVDLPVAEGQVVAAGQLLARIDPVPARSDAEAAVALVKALQSDEQAAAEQVRSSRAELAQAKARAIEAQATLRRTDQLHAQGLSPQADLDAARASADATTANVAAAEAGLARAEQASTGASRRVTQARAQSTRATDVLEKTEIRAPMSGIVSRLQVRSGEMVVFGIQNQPGTTLMTVSDLAQINAEVTVAEADVLRLRTGQPATVTLEALPGKRFSGRVVEVGASALPVTGTAASAREFRVRVRLDTPDPGLRPGLTCDADILTDEKRNVLTAPLQAVVLRASGGTSDRTGIFTVKDGRASFVPVTTGIIGGLDVEIAGAGAGTPIAIGPFQVLRELQDGAPVRASGR